MKTPNFFDPSRISGGFLSAADDTAYAIISIIVVIVVRIIQLYKQPMCTAVSLLIVLNIKDLSHLERLLCNILVSVFCIMDIGINGYGLSDALDPILMMLGTLLLLHNRTFNNLRNREAEFRSSIGISKARN